MTNKLDYIKIVKRGISSYSSTVQQAYVGGMLKSAMEVVDQLLSLDAKHLGVRHQGHMSYYLGHGVSYEVSFNDGANVFIVLDSIYSYKEDDREDQPMSYAIIVKGLK